MKVANSCPNFDAKNTVAASAYILSVKARTWEKYELGKKPVAVLAQDSTTIFVKKNTAVSLQLLRMKGMFCTTRER